MLLVDGTLWFDVGIKRYTTIAYRYLQNEWLWFDVGIKRYTTLTEQANKHHSCGLM